MSTDPEDIKAPSGKADHVEHKSHLASAPVAQVSALQSAKENPRVILFSLCACIGSVLWGYDIGGNRHLRRDGLNPLADSLIRYQHDHNGPPGFQASIWLRVPRPTASIGNLELTVDSYDLSRNAHR
jgi:hypothetical protein